jgi:hypothetical protein
LRHQEAAEQQTERADKLQDQLACWHQICDELWKRGYGQLSQRVNETPLGSCLRLIDQGTPESAGYWGADGDPVNKAKTGLLKDAANWAKAQGENNPLFSSVNVHLAGGQVFTTPAQDASVIPWIPWAGGPCPLDDKDIQTVEVKFDQISFIQGDQFALYRKASILDWETGNNNLGGQRLKIIAYRVIKWKPVKIPLESSDLPLGASIRFPQDLTKEAMILGRDLEFVWISGHGSKAIKLDKIMDDGAEYRLPGSDDWKPCYKIVNPTPHAENSPET